MTIPFVGTPSIDERLHSSSQVFRALAKRIAYTLRCGLPGVITAFDPAKQYATVQLSVTENVFTNGDFTPIAIPPLQDVLVLFPGDSQWCITFPSLIGAECYVCFADMCINGWATHGGTQNQEVTRRHDLSDGFAILSPRSQPHTIPDYSTTAVEIRSLDNNTKISMNATSGVSLSAAAIQLNGPLHSNQTALVGTTASTRALPIVIGGTTYYIRLSTTP